MMDLEIEMVSHNNPDQENTFCLHDFAFLISFFLLEFTVHIFLLLMDHSSSSSVSTMARHRRRHGKGQKASFSRIKYKLS